jgi:hypothetical protein
MIRKKLHKSWTVWFNGLLLASLPLFEMTLAVIPQLQEFLPENVYKIVGLIAVVGNILLRFKTNTAIKDK